MSLINRLLGALIDGMLFPFKTLPPAVGVAVVSLVVGIGMLFIFKLTSDQTRIARVKDLIMSGFYEIRLRNDSLASVIRAQFRILGHNLRYVALSLVPLVWMLIPVVLIIAQLQAYYGYEGLKPGETALFQVTLKSDWREKAGTPDAERPDLQLQLPEGLHADAPPVWIPAKREMAWRIVADDWGDHEVQVALGGETYSKGVHVTQSTGRRTPFRSAGFMDQVLYPAEAGLPGSARWRGSASPTRTRRSPCSGLQPIG